MYKHRVNLVIQQKLQDHAKYVDARKRTMHCARTMHADRLACMGLTTALAPTCVCVACQLAS